MSEKAALWGPDHVEYGEIAVEAVGEDAALAISRGMHPKPYWSLDPNEDAVAAVVGERATLLVCADGHNGFDSVRPAVETVLERLGEDPPEPGSIDPRVIFARANVDVLLATGVHADARSQSRTTLAFALVSGRRVQWAAMGDAPIYFAESGGVRLTIRDDHHFVGYPMDEEMLTARIQQGREKLDPGAWVVLASDGISDYAGEQRGAVAVEEATAPGSAPEEIAEALIRRAFDGGAGDNVAVALARVRA